MKDKRLMKGLALAAAIVAAAALVRSRLAKSKKAKAFEAAARKTKDHVIAHAKELKKLSKASYEKIVDTTVAEYRSMKSFSAKELAALARELKDSWRQVDRAIKDEK